MTSASLFKLIFLAAIIGIAHSVGLYQQCAGDGYGTFPCDAGLQCFRRNSWFSSCQFSCPRNQGWECEAYLPPLPASTVAAAWDQCGGDVWYGPVQCPAGYICYIRSIYYSQCRPIGDCPAGWSCNAVIPVTAAPPSTYVPGGPIVLEMYSKCNGYANVACPTGTACFRNNVNYAECRPFCPAGWACETDYAGLNEQCGGASYVGITRCAAGLTCYAQTAGYAQCRLTGDCPVGWACPTIATTFAPVTAGVVAGAWDQCGGNGWAGAYLCPTGYLCYTRDIGFAQCRPAGDCPSGWSCPAIATTVAPVTVPAVAAAWDQCGGNGWAGAYVCPAGYTCYARDIGFAQCRPTGDCPSGWSCPVIVTTAAPVTVPAVAAAWDQCGGNGWAGAYVCPAGYTCYIRDAGFAQCRPTSDCPAGWSCPVIVTTAAPVTVPAVAAAFDQCGGNAWAGAYLCPAGYTCYTRDATFAQCRPTGDCPAGWGCPVVVTTTLAPAIANAYDQCGGSGWAGASLCPAGFTCYTRDAGFAQCRSTGDCPAGWACPIIFTTTAAPAPVVLAAYTQCNGVVNSVCTAGTACFRFSATYSECRAYCPAGWACETDYAGLNEQCGGAGYIGLTNCAAGLACYARDATASFCATSCPGAGWLC